mgnify:FL=1
MLSYIEEQIKSSIELRKMILDEAYLEAVGRAANVMIEAYKHDGKVLFCGNGGSAADAQHLAAELVGRFKKERRALPAIALHVNTSALTAIANDYSYSEVFVRQLEAFGIEGDVLVGITTSGKSENVLKALAKAKDKGLKLIALVGMDDSRVAPLCDVVLGVPSYDTPRVQEVHMLWGHIICGLVEGELFHG